MTKEDLKNVEEETVETVMDQKESTEVVPDQEPKQDVKVADKISKITVAKAIVKKNWKKIAAGAGLVALGATAAIVSRIKKNEDEDDGDDYIEGDYTETVEPDETEEVESDDTEAE